MGGYASPGIGMDVDNEIRMNLAQKMKDKIAAAEAQKAMDMQASDPAAALAQFSAQPPNPIAGAAGPQTMPAGGGTNDVAKLLMQLFGGQSSMQAQTGQPRGLVQPPQNRPGSIAP